MCFIIIIFDSAYAPSLLTFENFKKRIIIHFFPCEGGVCDIVYVCMYSEI